MLKIKAIHDETPDARLFAITSDGIPSPEAEMERVARLASHLLKENELDGMFRCVGAGVLALDVAASKRTFFHDGIVFAALDAVNDPVRNPTLTMLAADRLPKDGAGGPGV